MKEFKQQLTSWCLSHWNEVAQYIELSPGNYDAATMKKQFCNYTNIGITHKFTYNDFECEMDLAQIWPVLYLRCSYKGSYAYNQGINFDNVVFDGIVNFENLKTLQSYCDDGFRDLNRAFVLLDQGFVWATNSYVMRWMSAPVISKEVSDYNIATINVNDLSKVNGQCRVIVDKVKGYKHTYKTYIFMSKDSDSYIFVDEYSRIMPDGMKLLNKSLVDNYNYIKLDKADYKRLLITKPLTGKAALIQEKTITIHRDTYCNHIQVSYKDAATDNTTTKQFELANRISDYAKLDIVVNVNRFALLIKNAPDVIYLGAGGLMVAANKDSVTMMYVKEDKSCDLYCETPASSLLPDVAPIIDANTIINVADVISQFSEIVSIQLDKNALKTKANELRAMALQLGVELSELFPELVAAAPNQELPPGAINHTEATSDCVDTLAIVDDHTSTSTTHRAKCRYNRRRRHRIFARRHRLSCKAGAALKSGCNGASSSVVKVSSINPIATNSPRPPT